ncbi:hypothetical protein EKO27_g5941 [Xylaria grammica]|uniref:Uncharacterized protein n=1 Tax=Xylaria grammica TaxID=363999 RepID=A0A439D419_9PEZI|nr:hypothetical protein EKO27_g5941 [Xylaria grammica]
MAPQLLPPSTLVFDSRTQIIDNCEFIISKDDIVQVITSKDPADKLFKAYAIRCNEDSREVLLASEPCENAQKAVESLHTKSCEAIHNYVTINGFSSPRDLKTALLEPNLDDDDAASIISGHSDSSTAAFSEWGSSGDEAMMLKHTPDASGAYKDRQRPAGHPGCCAAAAASAREPPADSRSRGAARDTFANPALPRARPCPPCPFSFASDRLVRARSVPPAAGASSTDTVAPAATEHLPATGDVPALQARSFDVTSCTGEFERGRRAQLAPCCGCQSCLSRRRSWNVACAATFDAPKATAAAAYRVDFMVSGGLDSTFTGIGVRRAQTVRRSRVRICHFKRSVWRLALHIRYAHLRVSSYDPRRTAAQGIFSSAPPALTPPSSRFGEKPTWTRSVLPACRESVTPHHHDA